MLSRLARWRTARLLIVGALVTALYVTAPTVAPSLLEPARAAQPVSGAFSLGSGVGGQIDPRTGQFSVSVPLVNVPSRGGSGVQLSLSWDQARAGANVDRYGWGAGWSIGTTFVDPQGGITVYPANGGAYAFDDTFDSRLKNYVLRDLTFQITNGSAASCGEGATDSAFTLAYDDGRLDCFDANGNLAARVDRFGNRTTLSYQQVSSSQWQPTAITDAYGLATTFAYGTDDNGNPTVTVSAPKRSDGVVSATTVTLDAQNRVQRVADPVGSAATFAYTRVPGSTTEYVSGVTGPAGAQSGVTYQQIAYPGAAALLAVKTLQVTDADGNPLSPVQTFSMNPPGNQQRHNFAGYPTYLSGTEDRLFASADDRYQYATEITTGGTSTVSTYDSAHRLVSRQVSVGTDSGDVTLQQQTMTYPPLEPPQSLSANYARPLTSSVSYSASSGPKGVQAAVVNRPRTVSTSSEYDDHGRIVKATDEAGTTTKTTYDSAFGLVTSSLATGADGTRRSVTNVLSPDGKTISSTSEAEAKAGAALSARTVVSYGYDPDGSVSKRTVTWADDAAPPDNGGGPASATTSYVSTVNSAARTRTVALTAGVGTTAARTSTTVLDLVSGLAIRITDGAGRVTTRSYDAGGRPLKVTPPTGLATTTSYRAASGDSPATQTVTEADGHVTRTTYDPLGRATTVTDNVRDGAFVADPTVRTVGSVGYSPDGLTRTTTDRAGRTTTTTNDALARPVQEVGPTGVTKQMTYDDVANSVRTAVIGDNASGPSQLTSASYDALNREVSSRTTYPLPGRGRPLYLVDPLSATGYDGIGRKTSRTAGDLTAVPDYAGPGGTPATTVVGPAKTARTPGDPITAADTSMITGHPTLRILQQPGEAARPGSKVSYDATGNITSITDPLGKTTNYTYAPDGRPKTRTSPSGTVTTNTYDPTTGQLTTVTTAAGGATNTVAYTYVPAGALGAGLVKTLTNESGTLTYSYDADRNPVGVSYPDGSKVSSDYADNGELLTSTDATGAVTTYVYYDDNTSSLKSATQVRAGVTLASVGYTYDGLDRIATTTRGNGMTTTNTYTANNLLDTQVTNDRAGNRVEAHDYDYDNHHNLVRKTDTTAPLGTCRTRCATGPTTTGTWTTTYRYDAYDRLIGSRVYSGATATGNPVTTIGYDLDASGNITSTTRTTALARQAPATTVTTDQIDAAGQLTQRTVGTSTTKQAFDPDGRVQTSVAGTTTTYRPDGLPATATKGGATTTYSYWADGSRRSATTAGAGGATVNLYYRADGALANDTTTSGATSATASYLLTAGREARTLRTGSSAVTTGTGVGYYLRDRHNSVTALVDSAGAVTNTYAYADYGASALLDGRPGAVTGAAGPGTGRANPFGYAGAAVKGMYTEAATGTLVTPARVYDPAQGRFTSRDAANVHNRYAGFDTNPIMKIDPSGQSPFVDFFVDALFMIVFIVSAVETGGAAAAAGAEIYAAVEAGEAAAAGASAAQATQAVATAANVVGAVSYGTRLVDDVGNTLSGKHFLSDDQRNDLANVGTLAGGIAGAAGLVGAGAKEAAAAVDAATDAHASSAATTSRLQPADARPDATAADDPTEVGSGQPAPDTSSSDDDGWNEGAYDYGDGGDQERGDDSFRNDPARSRADSGAQQIPDDAFRSNDGLTVPLLESEGDRFRLMPEGGGLVLTRADNMLEGAVDSILNGDRTLRTTLQAVEQLEDLEPPNLEGPVSLITKDPASAIQSAPRPDNPRAITTTDLVPIQIFEE